MWFFFFPRNGNRGKTFQVQCLKRAKKKNPATTFLLKSNHFKKRKPQQEATLVKQRHSLSLLLGERRLGLLLQLRRYCLMRPSMVAHASNPALRRLEQENAKSRQLGLQIPHFPFLKHPHVRAMTFVCEQVSSTHCGLQGLNVGRQA